MKASALLQGLLLSALLLGLSQAFYLPGGCNSCGSSPCGCTGLPSLQASLIPVAVPMHMPSCGCGSPSCGGSCGMMKPSCGCGSPSCGGSCGMAKPSCGCGSPSCGGSCGMPKPSCGCGNKCGGSCGMPAPPCMSCGGNCGGSCGGPRHGHGHGHGLGLGHGLGMHGLPCGRLVEVTKTKKFMVPPPHTPRCHMMPMCGCGGRQGHHGHHGGHGGHGAPCGCC